MKTVHVDAASGREIDHDISVSGVHGWVLICPIDEKRPEGKWYVCWDEVFRTKRAALDFARSHGWSRGFRAARGSLHVAADTENGR